MAFLEGLGVGLAMIVFIGPVFFTLLKSALNYGFWAGMMVALGIFVSDVVCVVLCSFGAIPFFEGVENQFYLAVVGSFILFGLGFKYLLKPNVNVDGQVKLNAGQYSAYFTKGFLVNFVNPFVFIVWISVIGFAQGKYGAGQELWIFLTAALLGILLTDSLKVVFANKIKALIRPGILLRLYQAIGIILLGFGCRLVWYAVTHQP